MKDETVKLPKPSRRRVKSRTTATTNTDTGTGKGTGFRLPSPDVDDACNQDRRRNMVRLLTTLPEIHCLNPPAWFIMAALRLQLMCQGKREAGLAVLVKAWEKPEEV